MARRHHEGRPAKGTLRMLLVGLAVSTLAGCGQRPVDQSAGSDPEPTSPYRQSKARYSSLLADCLTAAGFPTTFDPETEAFDTDGVGGPATRQALDAARERYTREIDPRRLEPPPALTDDQWRQQYAYLLAQADCLRDLGHPVPAAPNFSAWRESDGEWDPYGAVVRGGHTIPGYEVLGCQNVDERPPHLDW